MELYRILHLLRRHALLVVIVVVVAVLAGLVTAYDVTPLPPKLESKARSSGLAAGRVLVSARKEPPFGLEAKVASTLGDRAALLADLVSTEASRGRIARHAGIRPDELAILGPSAGAPMLAVPLAERATEVAGAPRAPYVLTTSTEGGVPIVTLRAVAPDSKAAARVVDAAAEGLDELLSSRSSTTPVLTVERLGPPVERTLIDEPKRVVALAVALVVLAIGLAAIVVVDFGIRRLLPRPRRMGSRTARSA
jgi:hypothetical protein